MTPGLAAALDLHAARHLASQIGLTNDWDGHGSRAFHYFADGQRFLVVSGVADSKVVQLALAYGLTYRGDRRLVLALPAGYSEATMQRAPWLRDDVRPEIWLHDGATAEQVALRDRGETTGHDDLPWHKQGPAAELAAAATPKHLGERAAGVVELVEWATTDPRLDPGHRRGERSWHCMGQKVLSITRTHSGLRVVAGIHYSKPAEAPEPVVLLAGATLTSLQVDTVRAAVEAAIEERLNSENPRIHRPDEHWLQAAIRRRPSVVGVEQPALREVPAWRPQDGPAKSAGKLPWGRGYIDLIGVDGHGDIRIVETKLTGNDDALLVLQGLDYYIWANAYRDVLRSRLGAPSQAELEIHYVVGEAPNGAVKVSHYTKALAEALDDSIRWRFQVVRGWYRLPDDPALPEAQLLAVGAVPG